MKVTVGAHMVSSFLSMIEDEDIEVLSIDVDSGDGSVSMDLDCSARDLHGVFQMLFDFMRDYDDER